MICHGLMLMMTLVAHAPIETFERAAGSRLASRVHAAFNRVRLRLARWPIGDALGPTGPQTLEGGECHD